LTVEPEKRIGALDVDEALLRIKESGFPPAIIVPVYNAADELDACIRSVLRHTGIGFRLILIDDASPDARVGPVLSRYGEDGRVEVVRNETNLGFTRTVNRGIELAGEADVVLLNADTEVTPGWLVNLQLAAYSGERIATATPFSDNAGAFSAPVIGEKNPLPEGLSLNDCARLVRRASARAYPRTPTGNGYCMYVRRAALAEVGALDAEAFPRGYGEENDFCMRAARAGWAHVVDDATLIHHVRSASFGEEKTPLMKAGRALIDERYPDYTAAVRAFVKDETLEAGRQRIAEAYRTARAPVRPRILYVISTKTGGTPQTNADLMEGVCGHYEPWLLRCDAREIELSRVEGRDVEPVETIALGQDLKAFPHVSPDYDAAVRRLLVRHAIELVHIRHIAWHSLNLPAIAKALAIPVAFSFHDYYTVCPTVKLLDENLDHCGGVCTAGAGECKHELWPARDFPPLKHRAIHDWKRMMGAMLQNCDAFVTTAESTRALIRRTYPQIAEKPFEIIEHGRDLTFADLAAEPGEGEPLRILLPGNIGVPKGSLILAELDRLDRKRARADGRGRRYEFHLLGHTNIAERSGIVFHGPYQREDFAGHVARIRPHLGMILSIWPETYCHTLTELWSCGLPVVAFDFGAVGDRIRAHGGGWLIDGTSAADRAAEAVLARLDAITTEYDRTEQIQAIRRWHRERSGLTVQQMTARYVDLYDSIAFSGVYLTQFSHRACV
ncbi:MAG TPA: glycosyltransferase, partial [Pararhizobium sp.]|nr:glycosyltransferase [Pararhizobium sp.]